jgi:hypothetical protein
MNRDDIIRIAHQAGGYSSKRYTDEWRFDDDDLKQFAELIAAAEREACADMVLTLTCMGNAKECFEVAATYIRARGQ